MMKLKMVVVAVVLGTFGLVATLRMGSSASADLGGDQADSVRFQLGFVPSASDPSRRHGHVVYCGVDRDAEPYVLDVAVSNPPRAADRDVGWLNVSLQEASFVAEPEEGDRFSVPFNSSFSFSLTLGGVPNVDQIVRVDTPSLGDVELGGGAPFLGIASVRARKGATDPFNGDGRRDNFCVSIGQDPAGQEPGLPGAEFLQGEISTSLRVPDGWVTDGNGADGGVLRGHEG